MKDSLIQNHLVVKKSSVHGYGVFALKNMAPGEILEECYGIDFECDNYCLQDFTFAVCDTPHLARMLTGFGPVYNHSDTPNAVFMGEKDEQIVTFTAKKPIKKGEEILVGYGNSWFASRHIVVKRPPFWRRPVMKILYKLGAVVGIYVVTLQLMDVLLKSP